MGLSLTRKLIDAHLVSGKPVARRGDRAPRRPGAAHRHQRLHGDPAVRGHGLPARQAVARRRLHRPQRLRRGLAQLRRPSVHADGRAPLRRLVLEARQRHLPPGALRVVQRPRRSSSSARTATRRSAARRACSPSARAGSTWRWRWAADRTTCPCRASRACRLTGQLRPWVSAKDVILELLRRYSARGGSGKVFEYAGPGVATLSLPAARDHLQHGRRADADDQRVPVRRGDARVLRAARTRRRTGGRSPPTPTPSTTRRSSWTSRRSSRSSRCPARRIAWCRSARWRARPSIRSSSAPAPTARGRTCGRWRTRSAASAWPRRCRSSSSPEAPASSRSWRARGCWPICSPPAPSSRSRRAARAPASATCRRPARKQPPRVQPQFPRAKRHQGRRDLSLLAGDGRGVRAPRRDHRSAEGRRRRRPALPGIAGRLGRRARAAGLRPKRRMTTEVFKGPNIKEVPRGRPPEETLHRARPDQARRQGLDGRHLAVGHRDVDVPHERPRHLRVLLPERRRRLRGARQGGRRRRHRGRRPLRAGLVARGGGAVPASSRRARRAGQELRAHPSRQPDQLGHRAARVRRPGRLRSDRARRHAPLRGIAHRPGRGPPGDGRRRGRADDDSRCAAW